MATSKTFQCDSCQTEGKIVIKTQDVYLHDIVCCPVCGADIYDEDETVED
jgi:hypothetical protein